MGRWGARTYVNCYFTHTIGVSLGHSANCAYVICIYTLVLFYICIATVVKKILEHEKRFVCQILLQVFWYFVLKGFARTKSNLNPYKIRTVVQITKILKLVENASP